MRLNLLSLEWGLNSWHHTRKHNPSTRYQYSRLVITRSNKLVTDRWPVALPFLARGLAGTTIDTLFDTFIKDIGELGGPLQQIAVAVTKIAAKTKKIGWSCIMAVV